MRFDVLRSDEDRSVNFVARYGSGFLEARYVRRTDDYFICYVSSHSGCNLSCRFCHLTRTRQTSFDPADYTGIMSQVERVLEHHANNESPSPRMNINFMARGEPLLNPIIVNGLPRMHDIIVRKADNAGVNEVRYNPSSIFPKGTEDLDLVTAFAGVPVTPFWSLYSLNPSFRKRWLPKAIAPERALAKLLDFQAATGEEVVLHWALIAGENDRDEDFDQIGEMVIKSGIEARLNLVRYNPADPGCGEEAPEERYQAALDTLSPLMIRPGSRIVPRVGYDVKASCGMFISAA